MDERGERTALADALADRALRRAGTATTLGGFALGALALIFLLLADGRADVGSLPQVFILGTGQVAGLVLGLRCQLAARRLTTDLGSGQLRALTAATLVRRGMVTTALVAGAVALWSLAMLRPFLAAALSVATGSALLAQFMILLHLQRRALLRATGSRGRGWS